MDLTAYRASALEQRRTSDLLRLVPAAGRLALDIGARDGHFSVRLAGRYERVIALDLCLPAVDHPRVQCLQGDATRLPFPDASVDLVFCAEVLEHIPPPHLQRVGAEMVRVARGPIVVGVPYRQDIRLGRTTCEACGGRNPPWGHVNTFDEAALRRLFGGCDVREASYVGPGLPRTNAMAAWLMDAAGNPFGTYDQEEACIHCGACIGRPRPRSLKDKALARLALHLQRLTPRPGGRRAHWIHMALVPAGWSASGTGAMVRDGRATLPVTLASR
jgi:hypothetical protein